MKKKNPLLTSIMILSLCAMNQFANAQTTSKDSTQELSVTPHCYCNVRGYGCGALNWGCTLYCRHICGHAIIDNDALAGNTTASKSASIISFAVEQTEKVSLQIFDITGRLVKTLANASFEKGFHKIEWNATDTNEGVYLLCMNTESFSETQKLIVTKE